MPEDMQQQITITNEDNELERTIIRKIEKEELTSEDAIKTFIETLEFSSTDAKQLATDTIIKLFTLGGISTTEKTKGHIELTAPKTDHQN